MAWPRFALITEEAFRKLKAKEQMAIHDEARDAFPQLGEGFPMNTSYRWDFVKKAATIYRDKAARHPADAARAAPATGLLTATECNEWLLSLPPVPLYGEERPDA